MKMIQIPKCKFAIGSIIMEKDPNDRMEYLIYDISYSLATGEWYYRYSYWRDGYEHYCKSPIKCVENLFEVVAK
jgi:hypothetical protein